MPRLRRVSRTFPPVQPRILALAFTWPYSERHGWRIEDRGACGADAIARVQANRYRVAEALAIAGRFAPTDAQPGEQRPSDSNNTLVAGTSEALAGALGPDAYEYVGADGAPGELQVVLYLDDAGEVYSIDVNLGGVED